MERTVSEIMHQGVLTCTRDTTIQEAAALMVANDVSALVVIDGTGRLDGLLSRTDLVKTRVIATDHNTWRDMRVGNVMVSNVVCVKANDTIFQAGKLMIDRHIHRVIVVEETQDHPLPVGILSVTDVVRDMALVEAA